MALDLDEMLRVRIAAEDKKLLEAAARDAHLSLAAWARMVLLDAAACRLTQNTPTLDNSTNNGGSRR